mgnify:CR=1 FL=1
MRNIKAEWLFLLLSVFFYGGVYAQQYRSAFFRKAHQGTYVIAHRGAHEGIPENSLAAYQYAIDLGCDFVEIDVRTTKDGHFVSMHNSSVDGYVKGAHGKVKEMTLQELKSLDIGESVGPKWKGTRIPEFDDILKLCKGKIGIYLDLKDAPVPELMKIIRKYGMEEDIVWYIPSRYLSKIDDPGHVFGKSYLMPDPGSEKNLDALFDQVSVSVIASDMDNLTPGLVNKAHQHQVKVFVDDKTATPDEWEQMIKTGVDGIQTDRPEELISFLKGKTGR